MVENVDVGAIASEEQSSSSLIGVEAEGSPAQSGVDSGSPAQSEKSSGASETSASEEESSQEPELLADGTRADKPISYKDARRMAETAAKKAVEDYRQQLEVDNRRAVEENMGEEETGLEESVDVREQMIQDRLRKYAPTYHETMRPLIEPLVDEILSMREDTSIIKLHQQEILKREFLRDHPDVKEGSKDYTAIVRKIWQGTPPEDAYRLVMKSEGYIREDERKKVLEEQKTRNETLRKSQTLGGIDNKGKGGNKVLPSGEEDDAWFRSRVR